MAHPFANKLFVFIGEPERCTRHAARDALDAVGGVTDERINSFTNYVVAFSHNGKSQKYKRAIEDDKQGYLTLLNEEQFFDILEGRAKPPAKPTWNKPTLINMPLDPVAEAQRSEETLNMILNRKRMNNAAKYGVPTSDGGRIKVDLRPFDMVNRVMKTMSKNREHLTSSNSDISDRCDSCSNPSKVHIGDDAGTTFINLCNDCHNELIAQIAGTETPDDIPKQLDFKFRNKTYHFTIEVEIFPTGKVITATEIGKTKRKTDVSGELDDDFGEMLETLKKRIKKLVSVKYMGSDGYLSKNKAVGYIEYNHERDACDIIIDGNPYTWDELEKNISAREGWKIKIEFGDIGDELD